MGFTLPRLAKFLPWTHQFGQQSAQTPGGQSGPSPPEGGQPSGAPGTPHKFGDGSFLRTILGSL